MRNLTISVLVLVLSVLMLSGCGGGGGGGGGDTILPTTSISSPADGATVSGTIAISATASDNVGVARVEFYVNNVLKSSVITFPYSYNWDTVTLSNGTYTLYTKAYDAAGNIGQSPTVTVTLSNPATKQATIVLSSQGTPSQIGGFELSLTLPAGATVLTDVGGTPLSSEVFLSGQFAAYALLSDQVSFDVATRTLHVAFATSNSIPLGEFLTVRCNVPLAYTPDVNDLSYTTLFFEPNTAVELSTVTATATFN